MKYLFLTVTILISLGIQAQYNSTYLPVIEETNMEADIQNLKMLIVKDTTYDVKFYHLDVEVGIENPFIGGRVTCLIQSKKENLAFIKMDLKDYYVIDSIPYPVASYTLENDILTLHFSGNAGLNETLMFTIFYHGIPQLEGGYKGLRYEVHNGNEPVIATLSTPFLAHTWFPCKDGTLDKADSVYIDITIPDTVVNGMPLIAVSNGILTETEDLGNKKKFHWKHHYPIVPYYMMIAVSNYAGFQQTYSGNGYSFPTDYYVFPEHLSTAQETMSDFQTAMAYFTGIFGDYPFRNEKYGMTQLGYYGAIENQTNTIINNLSSGFYNTAVHELAHMWFGDMITCRTWHHAWLNEGFAVYATALYNEHLYGQEAYRAMMENYEYYDGGTVYLQDDSDPFNIFITIIYHKGAYVLHMLRGIMGDEAFFAALKAYATNPVFQFSNATTEDFQDVCETFYGQDLTTFFDQWIYDEYYPVYEYNFEYNPDTDELGIAIYQMQAALGWRAVFEMPMEIKISFNDNTDTTVKVMNDQQIQSYYFSPDKTVTGVELDPDKKILKQASLNPDINVSLTENMHQVVSLYPNPNTGRFILDTGDDKGVETELSITDMHGTVIYHQKYISTGYPFIVNIRKHVTGLYLLKLKTAKGIFREKIIFM